MGRLMRPLFFLALLPLLLALPTSPSLRQRNPATVNCTEGTGSPCEQTVFLGNGSTFINIVSVFSLSNADIATGKDPFYEFVRPEDKNIITGVMINPPTDISRESDNLVYSTGVTFGRFPGRASLRISLEDTHGNIHSQFYTFFVVGLVLFEEQGDQPHIVTGLNPNLTIVEAKEDGAFGTTVKVKLFAGSSITTSVTPDRISFVVPDSPELLPWNKDECPVIAEQTRLDARCAMAFSEDFSTFSIRIAPGVELTAPVRVQFRWEGIKEYQDNLNLESNVGSTNVDTALQDDIITSILVDRKDRKPSDKTGSGASTFAGWKIGIIAIVCVLLLAAAITVVCCFGCCKKRSPKKPQPDVVGFKDKFQEIGFLRRVSTLRHGEHEMDDEDQCCVEEPPTPPDSEILMLENESRGQKRSADGHIDGIIPIDRLNEDKSVEKLVLPPGVVRGVDLESSTEGASGFGYGSPSGENDITSYGRGMTSVPRENFTKVRDRRSPQNRSSASRRSELEGSRDPDYFRDSHERIRSLERDRARIRELDREIERERSARDRSAERMQPRASADEFADSGPVVDDMSNGMSRGRGGVDAAINRIRQLDLLNGPASRGLVGRNGEPIRRPDGENLLDGDDMGVRSVS